MPKLVQKQGYKQIQNTGLENFADLLSGVTQALQQMVLQKAEAKKAGVKAASAVQEEQTKFIAGLQDLKIQDPEAYNAVIETPQIREFMDPQRVVEAQQSTETPFDTFSRKRKEKKAAAMGPMPTADAYAPKPPPIDFLPKAPMTEYARTLKAAKLGEAQASIKTSALTGLLASERFKKLTPDEQLSAFQNEMNRIEGMTGAPPTGEQMSAALQRERPDLMQKSLLMKTEGSDEWRMEQSRQMMVELGKTYPLQVKTDFDRVKQLADYYAGLVKDPPQDLPKSWAGLQFDLEKQGQSLRDKVYKLDVTRLNMDRGERLSKITDDLVTNSGGKIDPKVAVDMADQLLKTGKWPAGFVPSPDLRASMDIKLKQLQIDAGEKELAAAAASNPRIDRLMQLLSGVPVAARGQEPYASMQKELAKEVALSSGWSETVVSDWLFWKKTKLVPPGQEGAGKAPSGEAAPGKSSALEGLPEPFMSREPVVSATSVPEEGSVRDTTPPPTREWNPAFVNAIMNQMRMADVVYGQAGPEMQARIEALQDEMAVAKDAKDAVAMATVARKLAALLGAR